MKYLLVTAFAASGMLLSSVAARAQYPPLPLPDRQEQGERDRDRDADIDRFQDRVFGRLRADLDRAFTESAPAEGDRGRVDRARERLNDCQRMIRDRHFDRRMFEDTFAAVQRVLDENRMPERTRDDLRLDVRELHRLQDRLQP